jgi:hypothetical protein
LPADLIALGSPSLQAWKGNPASMSIKLMYGGSDARFPAVCVRIGASSDKS